MLGPLLFNIYINDLVKIVESPVGVKLFADDCIILSTTRTVSDQPFLEATLDRLAEWCNEWDMVIMTKQ